MKKWKSIYIYIFISLTVQYIYCYTLHKADDLWTNIKPTIFFTNRSSIFIVGGYGGMPYEAICGDWYYSLLIVWLHNNVNRNCGEPQIRDTLMTSWQVFSLLLFVFLFFSYPIIFYLLVYYSILKYRKQIIVWFIYNFCNELY